MRKWFLEVQHGRLSVLPSSLQLLIEEQKAAGADAFFLAEGGNLLNEPDNKLLATILPRSEPALAIARMSESMAWIFDRLESELDQDVQHNYLKISFVKLESIHGNDDNLESGRMTTNFPELPENIDRSTDMLLRNLTTTLRLFFSFVQGAIEIKGWQTDISSCDWVSMTFNKAGD